MRELFDEVAGKSSPAPEEAVRRSTRTPQRKRFYKQAEVAETPRKAAPQIIEEASRRSRVFRIFKV